MKNTIELIKLFETPFLYATYCSHKDKYIIGYGQDINVYNGLTWTIEKCEQDLKNQVNTIHKILKFNFEVFLNSNQISALASLIHDIEMETFLKSKIPYYIKDRNFVLVNNAFLMYNKNGRVVTSKKVARRKQEQLLFNSVD